MDIQRLNYVAKSFALLKKTFLLFILALSFGSYNKLQAQTAAELSHNSVLTFNGIDIDDRSGSAVASGDINGDGIDDFIIGADVADHNGEDSGQTYVVFGSASDSNTPLKLSSLNGTNGFALNGINDNDLSGSAVASGDVNGDGIVDVIIGARFADPDGIFSGQTYVVFGSDTLGSSGTFELSSLNGTNGFALNGINFGDYSGEAVAGADINGDGIDDVIIGARFANTNRTSSGQTYVVFGSDTLGSSGSFELSSLNGTNGFALNGINTSDFSGIAVAGADINGDGTDDVIVGAPFADPNGTSSGQTYVVFGSDTLGSSGSFELSSLNGSNGFQLNGKTASHLSGSALASGDINGDGTGDVIIGAPSANPNGNYSGQSFVVFGGANVGASGTIELSSLNGTSGFTLNGINAGDQSGFAVASADINGDGTDDVIIGASSADPNGGESGQTYVVFGSNTQGGSGIIELSSLNGINGFALNGINFGDFSGEAVAGADINGDGIDDLIIGAPGAGPNGSGKTYGVSYNLEIVPYPSPILLDNALSLSSNLDISFTAVNNLDLNFDAIIDGATVSQSTFQVYGSQTGRYSGEISARDLNTLTFNPDTDFKPGEQILVTLSNSIADTSGRNLNKNYTLSFTTTSELLNPNTVSPNFVSTTVATPTAVFPSDLDGDGDIDLTSTSSTDNTIIWHRNNGSGSFTAFTVASASDGLSSPVDTRIADVDSDGDMDVLSASESNDTIHWFENDGNESFTTHTITSSADGVQSIFTADLDGDNDTDVISASENDNTIAWYKNDGSEVFTKQVISTSANQASKVLVTDINGDGSLDIVASTAGQDALAWYKNNGNGVFNRKTISMNTNAVNIAAADMDNDGDMDLVTVYPTLNEIVWYQNNGNQFFTGLYISRNANGASALHVVDYDGDGDVDILSNGSNTDKLTLYNNNNNNLSFSGIPLSNYQQSIASLATADIDGNGQLNIISSSTGDNQILWYHSVPKFEQTGFSPESGKQGISQNAIISASFNSPIDANSVNSSSFIVRSTRSGLVAGSRTVNDSLFIFTPTNDFLPGDLVTVTLTNAITDTFNTAGRVVSPQNHDFLVTSNPVIHSGSYKADTISNTATDVRQAISADIDGDGDMDVFAALGTENSVAWFENDGDQNFTKHTVATNLSLALSVFVSDLDNDGDMDFLSSSRNDGIIHWYENDGNQNFTQIVVNTNASGVISIFAYDVNSDGNLDVLSSGNNGQLAWYENNGSQSFNKQILSSSVFSGRSVHSTDMDGDGDSDIIVTSFNGDSFILFQNDGKESFSRKNISTSQDGAISVYPVDLDKDGDMDLIGANFNGDKVFWFKNNGNLSFSRQIIATNLKGPRSIRAGDVDGDGDQDVLVAVQNDDQVIVCFNDGNQNFISSVVTTNADAPFFAEFTDIDNDGDLDVLASSRDNGSITWYELVPAAGNASLELNGTDTFIDADSLAPHLSGSSSFAFEVWIKPDFINQTDPNDVTLLNFTPNGLRIYLGNNANKDQIIRVTGNNVLTGPSLTDNIWTHIAYTINSGTGILFVNGDSVGTHTTTLSFASDDNWNIGAIGSPGSLLDVFAGSMDELRFWNTTRTADQIRRNMFQRVQKNAPGLVAYFPLDESSGPTVFDRSDNNIRAMLSGTPNWSSDAHPYGTFITGSEGWRIITAPAANISYSSLLDTLWTQGFTGADHSGGASNVYRWNESGFSFAALTDGSLIPAPGEAFIAYVYDDDNNDGTANGFPKMIRIDSTQHSGDIAPSLSYTDNGTPSNDGWNLIGNPYGTSIDWDAPNGLSRSNLDASMYLWNHSAGSGNGAYQSWNGFAGTLSDGKLAPLQGFWVKANAANPSINFSALARSTGGVFLKEQVVTSVPQLTFTLADSSGSSQALVMFHEQALLGKDPYDAYKLGSLNGKSLALYSLLEDSSALEINALPLDFDQPLDIPVSYSGSSEIDFSLTWDYKLLPEEWEFMLTDHIAEISVDLKTDSVYTFSQDSSKAKKIAKEVIPPSPPQLVPRPLKRKASTEKPRFTMRVSKTSAVSSEPENDLPTKVELRQNYPNPFNPSTMIAYGLPKTSKVTLEVFDILGRRVATLLSGEHKAAGRHTVTFNASNLASGMYIYRLRAGNSVIIKKLTLIK